MERLQKIIARAGLASRRAAEQLIVGGRVRVNGRIVTELGAQADPQRDKVEVDGRRLVAESLVYVVLHKPRGVVSTMSDPEGRPTVAELVKDAPGRLYPVGRLDFHTSGTLLLTNDGDFANGLLHPRREVPKTYVLKVQGEMSEDDLERWRRGVVLDDGKTAPAEVSLIRHEAGKTWMEVTIHEGRNQQIRRMGEATGFPVMRLARVAFAGITTDRLPPGRWRELTADELIALRDAYGVPKRIVRGMATGEAPMRGRLPPRIDPRTVPRPGERGRSAPRAEGRSAPRSEGGAAGRGDRRPSPAARKPKR